MLRFWKALKICSDLLLAWKKKHSPKARLCLKCSLCVHVGWISLREAKVLFELKVKQNNGFYLFESFTYAEKNENNAVPSSTLWGGRWNKEVFASVHQRPQLWRCSRELSAASSILILHYFAAWIAFLKVFFFFRNAPRHGSVASTWWFSRTPRDGWCFVRCAVPSCVLRATCRRNTRGQFVPWSADQASALVQSLRWVSVINYQIAGGFGVLSSFLQL